VSAANWHGPERCNAMVSISGYLIGNPALASVPQPQQAELQWWYQYYFATERGRIGYDKYRREFAKLIWQIASPNWRVDDAMFERSAASFDNPDQRRHRHPQLPLAARSRSGRGEIRRTHCKYGITSNRGRRALLQHVWLPIQRSSSTAVIGVAQQISALPSAGASSGSGA
jgi:hypothetical protein